MNKPQAITSARIYKSSAQEMFKLIEKGVLFKLTGADEIEFDFREGGAFSLIFHESGKIFGEFHIIIPNEKIILKWNVNGFKREDETTIVDISIVESTHGVTITISHNEINSEQSAVAKQRAWNEILLDLEQEIVNISF